jgi:Na+-translocating ferredoxin:NAD+ oxidoreductase RnfG subunit
MKLQSEVQFMNKKTTTMLAAVTLGLVAVSGTAFAIEGLNQENREAIQNAIASNDYETWKELMTQQLTEERFNSMVDRYQNQEAVRTALQNGDYEAWKVAVQNMQQARMAGITEDDFNAMSQRYQEMMNGNYNGTCLHGIGPMREMRMGWGM